MFEAIVSSNGWDGVTAALQLVSHLEGDALNVALLVPAPRRVLSGVLLDALTEHYSSPGRLADHRLRFERVSRMPGEDPSVFAVELETLASPGLSGLMMWEWKVARLVIRKIRTFYLTPVRVVNATFVADASSVASEGDSHSFGA